MGMLRNDYRRALIMLRAVEKGCSGHARLERRTLMGTLSFVATQPDASRRLYAALVGRRGANYYAAELGELRRDSRGQYGLNASFDPRNIENRELESYQLAVVVAVGDDGCSVALSGNVEGSEEMDWDRVRQAACGLYGMEPNPERRSQPEIVMAPEAEPEAIPVGEFGSGAFTFPADLEPVDAEISDYVAGAEDEEYVDPELADYVAGEPYGDEQAEEAAPEEEGSLADIFEEQLEGEPSDFVFPEVEEVPAEPVEPEVEEQPICTLDIDLTIQWPEEIEPLRGFFIDGDAIEGPGIDGYSFVRAPMPEGSGFAFVAVGILVAGGVPARVCYALPGNFAAESPPGLPDYEWLGGSGDGWWIRFLDVETP